MKVSFITTVFNEEKTISRLLQSLISQTVKPSEVIIVDGGSSDKTVNLIKQQESKIQKNGIHIKIYIKTGNRSVGRNEAIKKASYSIIACSDSGNILDKKWLENITKPFKDKSIDVVAGYYKSKVKTVFQKCVVPYALVMEDRIDKDTFLPATRSIAFKKSAWSTVGGFNEYFSHNEDYIFARALKAAKKKIFFSENAIVYWIPRNNIEETFTMIYRFALGDAEANIWRPKVFLLYLRYFIALSLILYSLITHSVLGFASIIILVFLYITWAILKNYRYVKDIRAVIFLPIIQFTADFAVLYGTLVGALRLITGRKIRVIVSD